MTERGTIEWAKATLEAKCSLSELFEADRLYAAAILFDAPTDDFDRHVMKYQLQLEGRYLSNYKKWVRARASKMRREAELAEKEAAKKTQIGERPAIFPDDMQLDQVEAVCLEAIASQNDPLRHVEYGEAPAVISEKPDEVAKIEVLNEAMALYELAHGVTWLKDGKTIRPTQPGRNHILMFLNSRKDRKVPKIKRVVGVPIAQKNGEPLKQGYNDESGIYYSATLNIPGVPKRPTSGDMERAREIIDEPFQDFLFVTPADKAAILALQILPFVREFIPQQVPLTSARAARQGTGKDFLVKVALMPWGPYSVITPPASRDADDEWRKRITTELMNSASQLLITNVTSLFSNTLAGAITTGKWDDRKLGGNQKFVLDPMLVSWAMTENNAMLGDDWQRRILPARIFSNTDPPGLRNDFKIKDLESWLAMPEHRAEIVWAILVWVQYWISRGCPDAPDTVRAMSSFATFRRVMGGLLHEVGVEGFADNYMSDDTENGRDTVWRDFTDRWWKWCEDEQKLAQRCNSNGERETIPLPAKMLLPIAKEVLGLFTRKPNEREPDDQSLIVGLGKMLRNQRTGLFGRYRIEPGASKVENLTLWKLVEMTIDDRVEINSAQDEAGRDDKLNFTAD